MHKSFLLGDELPVGAYVLAIITVAAVALVVVIIHFNSLPLHSPIAGRDSI